jgi:hypothetical protein
MRCHLQQNPMKYCRPELEYCETTGSAFSGSRKKPGRKVVAV